MNNEKVFDGMKRIFNSVLALGLMVGFAALITGCSSCSGRSGHDSDDDEDIPLESDEAQGGRIVRKSNAEQNSDAMEREAFFLSMEEEQKSAQNGQPESQEENDTNKEIDNMEKDLENPVVVMNTNLGTMRIRLYGATPKHRDNFLKLVDEGFYKGIRFHRVINGFMIQGGDPFSKDNIARDKWGTGGPGYTIPAEFVDSLHHKKGAVAAARLGDMANPRRASSGSQFYIVQSEEGCAHLDGQYTVFGQVIEGLDVIDKIAELVVDEYDRPIASATIESVTRE